MQLALTPEEAGWEWTGLRILRLGAGGSLRVETGASEVFVLPLRGSVRLEVASVGQAGEPDVKFNLDGRASVFSAVTDFAYVGRDSVVTLVVLAGVCESSQEFQHTIGWTTPLILSL